MKNEELIRSLIAEAAKRHKVLLSPDDPILVTVTLNELLAARNFDQINRALDGLLLKVEDRITVQQIGTTQKSERIINRSLAAAQEAIELCTIAACKETRTANEEFLATIERLSRKAKQSQDVSVICCCLTGLMIFGALLWAM